MKQILNSTLLSIFVLLASAQGFAGDKNPCKTCNQPCSMCKCTTDECCSPCGSASDCCDCTPKPSYAPPCDPAYNAPYRVGVCWDFFVTGSYIYWQPLEDGLETGRSINGTFDENTDWLNFDYSYTSGFKVGLGMNFDWDGWDFNTEYTWLNQTQTTEDVGNLLLPAFIITDQEGDSLSSKWKLEFSMLDFAIGRMFYVGQHLLFRPHFGGKAVWIDQNYDQTLFSNDVSVIEGLNSSDSWAVGPSAGLQTRWDFYCGFYMYGNVGWSLLYTQFDSINISTNQTNGITIAQTDRKTITPEMDLVVGFGWGDYCDCKDRWYLNLSIGYELFSFWDQNQWRNFYSTGGNSVDNNLYLHGLTISARLDF